MYGKHPLPEFPAFNEGFPAHRGLLPMGVRSILLCMTNFHTLIKILGLFLAVCYRTISEGSGASEMVFVFVFTFEPGGGRMAWCA